ncbi:MAG: ImmA/IrrE family metallo-endopeptidase [Nitrospiraceae bacterium]|nr:MAG: ImmA/IrrE family metallo-endopeptidase [Nitrospiraceae bacterium]
MTEPAFQPPILSYEKINTYAENFLSNYGIDNELPVPIEKIVEFKLGIDIIPFPDLQRTFDIEGFISGDLKSIYVDEYIYNNRLARYYFTLAHEIGHYVIHKDLMENIRPLSVAAWKEFIDRVDDEAYGWLEYQAYAFGGLLLVPRKFLFKHFREQIKAMMQKIEFVRSQDLPKASYQEYVIEMIAGNLIKSYDVSIGVLKRRIIKEIEMGTIEVP